ncbi:interleukin-18 receptor 1 isoform X2 [Halichoerus grypus]|uniref:interleukin-18 receptor 1 isoform X2 n=1 Tax=Halichoerus grypus TaxID=9711 RepID=UPI001659DA5B|nr:interleukin-18 receptor 1 isoform X2 [Halichoerus grypus]
MHRIELLLTLLALTFTSTSETCTSRFNITAVRGEPFYLRYCSSASEPKNETAIIKWYKSSGSQGRTELNSSSSPRISLHDYVLEFWPVELEDSGSYFFQMGNDTHEWKLNVIGKSKHSCFAEKQLISKTVEVQKSLHVNCKQNTYYQKLVNRTSLYKNCEKMENSKNPFLQKNAEFKDQGYYTCMFFIHHNGKLFNVTKTFNVTIVGDRSKIIPVLLGPKLNYVKVELGKDVELNCSALANEKDTVYWNVWEENGKEPNVHEENITRTRTPDGKLYASRILRIDNINEKNLEFSYNCAVASEGGIDTINFVLLKKEEMVDIPGYVFTRGMIIAVLISVVAVFLVIMGVIYRVDLALFYRHFMGKDETLTDGKIYDAFVSYLKECGPENGEEHTFAVEILPGVLEKHFGYKLCIFERDVVPGGAQVFEIWCQNNLGADALPRMQYKCFYCHHHSLSQHILSAILGPNSKLGTEDIALLLMKSTH